MIERRGYVLVVSSLAAFAAAPGWPVQRQQGRRRAFRQRAALEVAHLGVDVGSAHMSWIDTPLVHDAKSDLSAFREMLPNCRGR